jgi:FAD-linked oxidoreductase
VTSPWSNWAGNQTAAATRVAHPATPAELGELLRAAAGEGLRVKPVGSGHSFTSAAATDGVRLNLDRMASLVRVDGDLVTVEAGMPLSVLNATLAAQGLALPNLGDIDAQTVSGALSTGTHGTGARYGCLSTFVESLTLVTADGAELSCSAAHNPDLFAAARVGIGALGVLSTVTLRCAPAFVLRAEERPGTLADVWAGLPEHVEANDHFEFFWFPYTDRVLTKHNNRVPQDDAPLPGWRRRLDDDFVSNTVFGGACRIGRAFPAAVPRISRLSARALSARTYTGPSHEVFCSTRRVKFVEMEYGLPRAALREAFDGLRAIVDDLPYKSQVPAEVRFTAADDIWLSHGFGRDNAYVAIHQYFGAPYEDYFRRFEAVATALGGRPHWGKLHYRDAESLAAAYPRHADFTALRDKLDPNRMFANAYTERVLGA